MNEDNKDYTIKVLDDHEVRIRKLEESDIKQQVQLAEIQKSQADLKILVMETAKEHTNSIAEQNKSMKDYNDKILDTLTSTIKSNNETSNKIKLTDRKEFWGIIGALIAALGAIVTKFFG